jgi:hypothetical protein
MNHRSLVATAFVAIVLVAGAGSMGVAGQAAKVDVSGEWVLTVESQLGKTNPTLTLKQDGEKLTGKYTSQLMGDVDLTGTVKGQAIEFSVSANVQGQALDLKYTGTVESKDSMKGTLSAGDAGGGTFTGARK